MVSSLLPAVFLTISFSILIRGLIVEECSSVDGLHSEKLKNLIKTIVPRLEGKRKGDAGKIGVIGGSTQYTGAPYFAAISALKVGADLVYVITTENAAPVIKSYSPDLIVYPYLNHAHASDISALISKMDVIVIGPGLGREQNTLKLSYNIIETCKQMKKPLVIDADGLYALSNNISILKDYPSPGAIITPNFDEARHLKAAVGNKTTEWYQYWGNNVGVLVKGETDSFYSSVPANNWILSEYGSGRRAGGQGDILAGALGSFFYWALQSELCENVSPKQIQQSTAAYVAAKLTRMCNSKAFAEFGRSMTASDMIPKIHLVLNDLL